MTLLLRYLAHSEIGLVRKNNQDSGYASPHLLVVADGMGGAAAGDLASAVAIDAIREVDAPTTADQMLPVLTAAIHQANDRIAELVRADRALDGMGTTVTGALFDGRELGLAHIGDSRAYLFRDDQLERLTHDHSWVQSLVDDGKINDAEAAVHPHRSLLLKVLNGQATNEPDVTRLEVREGDRLLFCSDGLCGLVDDAEIAAALREPHLEPALRQLVADAHAGGGIDNITIILADVIEGSPVTGADTVEAVVLGAAAERRRPGTAKAGGGASRLDPVEERGSAAGPARPVGAAAGPLSPSEDEARYNPQPPHKRRVLRPLVGLLAVLLVITAALGSAYAWGRSQYYVGADGAQVAIYQGLPDRVIVPLSRVFEVQTLPVADLPVFYRDMVDAGIEVAGLDAARQTVAELREAAQRCAGARQGPSASPKPTTSPRPSGGPTLTPGPAPTGEVAPSDVPAPAPSEVSATPSASVSPSSITGEPSC